MAYFVTVLALVVSCRVSCSFKPRFHKYQPHPSQILLFHFCRKSISALPDSATIFTMLYFTSHNPYLARDITFMLCILLPFTQAAPTTAADWWSNIVSRNQNNVTIAEELQCYSLPFGFLGFLSHIITHWTVAWTTLGRRPYWPAKKLTADRLDIALSLIQIPVTAVVAIVTIARCHSRWEIVVIAFWKLAMGVAVGVMALSASYARMKETKTTHADTQHHEVAIKLMMFFYGLALTLGIVGMLRLVAENIHEQHGLRWVCGVFGAVTSVLVILSLCGGEIPLLVYGVPAIIALFGDWVLAVLTANYLGAPSGDNKILFWVSH